jgi:hypothetical protein
MSVSNKTLMTEIEYIKNHYLQSYIDELIKVNNKLDNLKLETVEKEDKKYNIIILSLLLISLIFMIIIMVKVFKKKK